MKYTGSATMGGISEPGHCVCAVYAYEIEADSAQEAWVELQKRGPVLTMVQHNPDGSLTRIEGLGPKQGPEGPAPSGR